jgi:asparagine synthase (glutamine-hydrolysing)
MCGIAGFFSVQPQPAGIIGRMTDLIRHRGPDDEGFVLFQDMSGMPRVCGGQDTPCEAYRAGTAYAPKEKLGNLGDYPVTLALGHRRLSIVDLSPLGHQPMCTPDERFWIVFNGEVYNHLELRVELEDKGHRFLTHSDTEVMLAAYKEWGSGCLERFNGMFAFLIYDVRNGKLFAARDRFGIKPLYYRVSAQGVAFASEIKQFTVLPDWQARMNGQRVYDFLNWGISDHTDETMFDGVFQLRGGEALELDVRKACGGLPGGRLPVYRWYRLGATPFSGSMEDAAGEFRSRFTDAVRLHLRADVPVGSCLSGGLDSSSIVCVMNELLRTQGSHALQNTFSACADVKRFDEREWIEEVVRHTGVKAHYVYPSLDELFDTHEQILWHQDEPFGSTSIYAQWHVFKLAAGSGIKVMLDGQGADEQLAGYHGFFAPRFAALFKQGHWLRLWREIQATKRCHGYSEWEAFKRMSDVLMPEGIRHRVRRAAGQAAATPTWIDMGRLGANPVDPLAAAGRKADSIRSMSESMLTASNLQMLLHWEDRDSMAHSIESRVPFLDHRLVEFVMGLPDEYKLSGGVTKRVLREGMAGVLPERIRTRMDKLGFVTPEEVWLRERAAPQFRQAFEEAMAASGGILNERARTVMEEMISGKRPFSFMVWRAISFGAWIKRFNVTV